MTAPPPPPDPNWIDTLLFTIAAFIGTTAKFLSESQSPVTGREVFRFCAVGGTIGILASGGQAYFGQPFWITAGFAVAMALVGLSFITTAAQVVFRAVLQSLKAVSDARP